MTFSRKTETLALAALLAAGVAAGAMAHGSGEKYGRHGDAADGGCPYAGMGHGMMDHCMMMSPGMMGGYGPMEPGYGYGPMGPGYGYGAMGPGMMGPGMMGPGMMGPGMMGPGMMGPGMMGPGMMGPGMMEPGMMEPGMMRALPENLTPEQVRHMLEHQLEWSGNPNLKVGNVSDTDEDTITADVVTQDGSLVRRFEVDRHTGMMRPTE